MNKPIIGVQRRFSPASCFVPRASISGLYAIADSKWNPCGQISELVEKFLKGGCGLIQLRMKNEVGGKRQEVREVFKTAQEIIKFKKQYDFTFIVNDYPEIAAEVGADGVHIGSSDGRIEDIKKRFGDKLIVGYSSHSIDEAKKAADSGADYVAFGAIFPTKTKGPDHPIQGIEKLKEVCKAVKVPLVAIGGINRDNVRQVIDAGASAFAMISALSQAKDIIEEVRWYIKQCVSV